MKNQNKKSKRVNIESFVDLIDALIEVEKSTNAKLADAGVRSSVRVEEGVGHVIIKSNDDTVFSMPVQYGSEEAAFGPLKKAIERAGKALMPKAVEPEVVMDKLPAAGEMPEEKFRSEMDKLAETANVRLVEYLGQDISACVINFTYDGADTIVRSGQTEMGSLHGHTWSEVKRAKSIVWPKVDELKRGVSQGHRGGSFAERLDEIVKSANAKLAEMGEPQLVVEADSAAFYVKAGSIPLFSLPKGVGSADDALAKAKAKIFGWLGEVRGVVDRRKHNARRAQDLEANSAWDMAVLAKANPEMDKSELWRLGPNADAASTLVEAAKKAVKAFNASLRLRFEGVEGVMPKDDMKMSFRGLTRGIIVSFGDEPCFVSMFPLVGNNASVGETASYVEATIASIGESRMRFYASIEAELARQEKFKDLAARRDALESEISAMAM